jgi:hypothetical protein
LRYQKYYTKRFHPVFLSNAISAHAKFLVPDHLVSNFKAVWKDKKGCEFVAIEEETYIDLCLVEEIMEEFGVWKLNKLEKDFSTAIATLNSLLAQVNCQLIPE